MSDAFSVQGAISIDIGAKVSNFFVGGYFGLAFGGPAGAFNTLCTAAGLSCSTLGLRFGAEIQYHFLPAGWSNPWVGYGIGFESIALSLSQEGYSALTDSFRGIEYAHILGGVDVRASSSFGIGPFVDLSLGKYVAYHAEGAGGVVTEGDVQTTTIHGWIAVGLRLTVFP